LSKESYWEILKSRVNPSTSHLVPANFLVMLRLMGLLGECVMCYCYGYSLHIFISQWDHHYFRLLSN